MPAWMRNGMLVICLLFAVSVAAKTGKEARVIPISPAELQTLRVAPSFIAATSCTVGNDSAIAYYIDGWVTGEELYKAYIDPARGCPNPYPFTITEVNMPMQFTAQCTLLVSVDVEEADRTVPSCPVPGNLIDTSATYQIVIPGAGGYHLWIPLDNPVTVNQPIFAGVYLQSPIDAAKGAAVFCDDDARTCYSYNIWDLNIGFIDLVSNAYFNFPGRLALYINGLANGSSGSGCCQLAPGNSLAFGDVAVNGSKDMLFTITNCADTAITVNISETCGQWSLPSGGGTAQIAAHQSRQVTVRFSPTAAGPSSCAVSLGNAACGSVFVSGNGLGSNEPAPQVLFVDPSYNEVLMGSASLWAWENSGSHIIDYVSFEYSKDGAPYTEIGRDYDGTRAMRNGINQSELGDGFTVNWNFSNLPEGVYSVRALAVDTLSRSANATISVYLEPTPPVPTITTLANGANFCPPVNLLMTCPDENMTNIQVYRRTAAVNFSQPVSPFSQFSVGDANGDPNDGNFAINGEFGDYYSGPVAMGAAMQIWQGRGFINTMRSGSTTLTLAQYIEMLAGLFHTRAELGTWEEDLFVGLVNYYATHGNEFDFDFRRQPDYFLVRSWVEDEQRSAVLGLGGTPGLWVTVAGFSDWKNPDGSYQVSIMNPMTGTIQSVPMRTVGIASEMQISGIWHPVDIIISAFAKTWNVTRSLIGADMNSADGWSVTLSGTGITEGNRYFIRAIGRDDTSYRGAGVVLAQYSCTGVFIKGDYNNDGFTDLLDLQLLIEYVSRGGAAPIGGQIRADANCDNTINVADVIFFMNYLFGMAAEPCR